jgi:hypothetical protein
MRNLIRLFAISIAFISAIWHPGASAQLQCLPSSPIDCSTSYASILPQVAWAKERFSNACMQHDFCYRYGKATYGHSRSYCDSEFSRNMHKTCNKLSVAMLLSLGIDTATCNAMAVVFRSAVEGLGSGSFENASTSTVCEYKGPVAEKTCGKPGANPAKCWTSAFSEEGAGRSNCPAESAVSGIWCVGAYCDNKHLLCTRIDQISVGTSTTFRRASSAISEEEGRNEIRTNIGSNPGLISGMECYGSYCDNILVAIISNRELMSRAGQPTWLRPFSEEQGVSECPAGQFVAGLRCSGKYCDNLALMCIPFRARQ